MKVSVFDVKGMMCGGCESHVMRAVSELAGVIDVQASHVSGEVVVRHEEDGPTTEAVAGAIAEAGYQASSRPGS